MILKNGHKNNEWYISRNNELKKDNFFEGLKVNIYLFLETKNIFNTKNHAKSYKTFTTCVGIRKNRSL